MFIQSSYIHSAVPAVTANPALREQQRTASPPAIVPGAQPESTSGSVTLSQAARNILAAPSGSSLLSSQALLIPSQTNIDALQKRISSALPEFLAQNNIPLAPEAITYDTAGKPQFPPDYPYAAQFQQALEKEPTMARDLGTVNALASHFAEMQKSIPFQQAYAAATPATAGAVIAQYNHLFSGHQNPAVISLQFSPQYQLNVAADGKPLLANS